MSKPHEIPPAPAVGSDYLTTAEVAQRLRWSARTIRAKIAAGVLREGEHFFQPSGCQPRWKWSAIVKWLEGGHTPMVESQELRLSRGGGRELL